MNNRDILRFFSPRWFIAIMGTGAVANILQLISGKPEGLLHTAATVLLYAAVIGFPVALVFLTNRLFIDRKMLFKELNHSSLVQFYSAIFISASVCATGLVKIPLPFPGPENTLLLAKAFWGFSLVSGIGLAVFTPWKIITQNHGETRRILGFWFLPPVGLFVLSFAGNFLAIKTQDASWINNIALLNAILIGTASFLSLMLFTLFLLRALAFPFPQMDVIPSFTIGLAPAGVSIIALLSYLPVLAKAESLAFLPVASIKPVILLLALLIWGFGLWWVVVSVLITLTAALRKGIPVTLGYWAFIFPPAAFTLATLILGNGTQVAFIGNIGMVFATLVTLGWITVTTLTIKGIFTRDIFKLPASFSEILDKKETTSEAKKQIRKHHFQNKFPVFSLDIQKNHLYQDLQTLADELKKRITHHPVARYIADFDHFAHTSEIKGEMVDGLLNARNIIFCFGPKIEESRVMAARPRSFGITEFENHFTVSFLEAPSPKATQTMKDWVHSL
jgi:tellurite resistance protein TehA-like permease